MMKLKPFLSVTGMSKDTITIGLTDRYRITLPNSEIEDTKSERLRHLGLSISEDSLKEEDSRTISYLSIFTDKPASLLNFLRDTKVLVLGCGGLGSRIIVELAGIGVKNIITTDPDYLDSSNLARMPYFSEKDYGKLKVDLIKKYITGISPNCNVVGQPVCSLEYAKNQDISDVDFVFVTADGHFGDFFKDIGPLLSKAKKPHMPVGYWESTLIAGPLLIDENLADLRFSENSYTRSIVHRDFIPPSIGFANAIVSGVAINEFIKHIAEGESSIRKKQWQFDVFNLKSKIIDADFL